MQYLVVGHDYRTPETRRRQALSSNRNQALFPLNLRCSEIGQYLTHRELQLDKLVNRLGNAAGIVNKVQLGAHVNFIIAWLDMS